MTLKSVIICDSPIQLTTIAKLVNNHPNLNLIAEYTNSIEAVNGIKSSDIDVAFIDIERQNVNKYQFLEALDTSIQLILITGNPDYSLQAFNFKLTDYLYKPISQASFEDSVKTAVFNYEQSTQAKREEKHIIVKSNFRKRKVVLNDIKWVQGLGDYIKLVTTEGNVVILSTMKSFELKLPKDKFMRTHKSYIVNLEKVEKYNSKSITVEGIQLPLSRNKKTEFIEAVFNVQ
ncbi:MAG: LytTR family DNA-binding domain-containing protein [Melioribacteraceae bacterium]|nr:LytTR family DNA-binding domain-containing protein [Melioribacteraceae bacterium]